MMVVRGRAYETSAKVCGEKEPGRSSNFGLR